MRWKIKSKNVTENRSTGIKTTAITKQYTVTIGEAIGVGKSAVGAVQAAAKSLKNLNVTFPKVGLAPFATTASILATIVTGLEVYKKITMAVEKVTPIAQLIARGSGVWCSPGNTSDIAQIILGQIQSILMTLVISTINQLKDFVWNYEFVIKEIYESFEEPINKNIENLTKKVNNAALNESIVNLANDSATDEYQDSLIANISSGNLDLSEGIDWEGSSEKKWFSEAYITEYVVNGNKRQLRGSSKDLGIEYSDDNGETWNKTEQTTGSWNCFAKIHNGNDYRYIAGSKDFIESIKDSEDSDWVENKNYYYNDGKNFKTITKYYKENNEFDGKDKDEYVSTNGIYYSDDNGITWNKVATEITDNINDICEFEEKEGYQESLVASSDDFNGCWHSNDGLNWTRTYGSDKWLKVRACDATNKRIGKTEENETAIISTINVSSGYIFKNEIVASFEANINNLFIDDGRPPEIKEFFRVLDALIEAGPTPNVVMQGLNDAGYDEATIRRYLGK